MKNTLHLFYALAAGLLLLPATGNAQISYTQGFDDENHGWTESEFYIEEAAACAGTSSLVVNLYDGFFWGYTGETISPSLGTSNGGEITLTYSYKIVDWDIEFPSVPTTNDSNWGTFGVYYATSEEGPYTLAESITPQNHTESADCAPRSVSFWLPEGEQLYIRVYGMLGNLESDFLIYLDDIEVTQADPVQCSGTPGVSTTVATATALCNGNSSTLSLSPAYTDAGLAYTWQSSADGETFTDIAGSTGSTYSITQSQTTWYRAIVTCTASNDFVYSEPVQITNTGLNCLCDILFDSDIEPISRVIFAGIDNTSPAPVNGSPGVENFTGVTPGEVTQGETYDIALEGNTADSGDDAYENYFTVYIDWNQNSDLTDEGERYEIGSIIFSDGTDGIQATGQIDVPEDALPGLTHMRVIKLYDEYADDPCSSEIGLGYGQAEDYLLNVSTSTNSRDGFNAANFKYYPNPVTNVLNLNYIKNITGVEVFNIVGQKVISKTVNQTETTVDMSALSVGTYMVKVSSAEGSKTVKVVKQ
ncbi:T9SS type A sorting domain-containing protein [Flavobacterium sp. Sd200]|uniref:T9SS type A sorting domain-containing protein n=1 Tax=Flavobacterium sp. Sd200 TaxID=2692211 RepID=UPI001371499E|nr:T9SS type A sorting domain-containing protein [Flavobacterium sp. Sd200]MXN89820.1 T9SS type A sorting domain-containing protein [Flavobacterium sp. Sd200]